MRSAAASTNYGSATTLRVRSGKDSSYLGFTVGSLAGPLVTAKLRVWVTDASNSGGAVYRVSDTWSESTITYTNRPSVPTTPIATFGPVVAGSWAELDVTAAVTGTGPISFAIVTSSSNTAVYSSREALNAPQLALTVQDSPPAAPIASFTGTPTTGVAPLAVQFTDTSTGPPSTWAWDFQNDGIIDSTLQNPSFTYSTPGLYDVSLRVSNATGSDTRLAVGSIQVDPPPPAPTPAFSVAPASGTAPLPIQLTDLSTGDISGWAWDFQDDGIIDSTLQNPSFTYNAAGSYVIRLTVSGPGGTRSTTGPGPVTVDPPAGGGSVVLSFAPTADARVRQGDPTANLGTDVALRARASSSDAYRSFLKFDVSGVTGPVTKATLRLWVTDASAQGGQAWATTNDWTETGISWATMPPLGASSIGSAGVATLGTWSTIDVTPAVSGNGTVALAVTSNNSDSVLWSSREGSSPPQLVVEAASGSVLQPVAAFSGTPTSGVAPLTVQFTDTSSNGPTSWAWDFQSDGIIDSTLMNPSFTYQSPGSYSVSLTAGNSGGSSSVSHPGYILVSDAPPPPIDAQTLLTAGDIASCSSTGDEATAALLAQSDAEVLTLGDNVYDNGTPTEFANCYNPSWGAAKARTHPVVGNHEYGTSGASGYFGYFGAAAGDPAKGYYSFEKAGWHVVVLNSNCSQVGGCGAGSAQEQWLRADLASHPTECTVAAWHHPRFNSSASGNTTSVQPLWQALYDYDAEIVLVGHAHLYERFAPQTATGVLDPTRGIRQFTVGTGGAALVGVSTIKPNSEVRSTDTFGVLRLGLFAGTYSWSFMPVAGKTFTDSGVGTCHSSSTATQASPSSLTAGVQGSAPFGYVGTGTYLTPAGEAARRRRR